MRDQEPCACRTTTLAFCQEQFKRAPKTAVTAEDDLRADALNDTYCEVAVEFCAGRCARAEPLTMGKLNNRLRSRLTDGRRARGAAKRGSGDPNRPLVPGDGNRTEVGESTLSAMVPTPLDLVLAKDERRLTRELLSNLPALDEQAITLDACGLSSREIADIQHRTSGSVRTTLSRSRRRLNVQAKRWAEPS